MPGKFGRGKPNKVYEQKLGIDAANSQTNREKQGPSWFRAFVHKEPSPGLVEPDRKDEGIIPESRNKPGWYEIRRYKARDPNRIPPNEKTNKD